MEVSITQPSSYADSLRLSENATLELQTLGDAAELLVKLHEWLESIKARSKK